MMKKNEDRKNEQSDRARQHRFGSERGVALILVLVLSTIALMVMTMVLYVLTMGTQMSGSEKRYRTAHEATLGGIEVIRKIIKEQQMVNNIGPVVITYTGTFAAKMASADLAKEGLPSSQTDVAIDPANVNTYDLYVDIGNPTYRVYAKITQRQAGNTEKSYKNVRIAPGVVPAEQGMRQYNFNYYTFTILTQGLTNSRERVRMDLVNVF